MGLIIRALLVLDEFPKLGRLAAAKDSISILRGYGVCLWLLVQELPSGFLPEARCR
ncbi:MAG: hypothetical protein EOO40_01120 [Deltaproteobacteria bacterium]|nr:MAG: hypothetical protein EOO40_01120 [Deltaproteobacteria bacterium]